MTRIVVRNANGEFVYAATVLRRTQIPILIASIAVNLNWKPGMSINIDPVFPFETMDSEGHKIVVYAEAEGRYLGVVHVEPTGEPVGMLYKKEDLKR